MKFRDAIIVLAIFVLPGCAGFGRAWSAGCASSFGSDWVIVQYRNDGTAFHCWKLRDTSVSNESQSDGIYWKDRSNGHLVHIAGWYNRVQVFNGGYGEAGKLLGVDATKCVSGEYPAS